MSAKGSVYKDGVKIGDVVDRWRPEHHGPFTTDTKANVLAAARYLKERYGAHLTSGFRPGANSNHLQYLGGATAPLHIHEEDTTMQQQTTLGAPDNPYRRRYPAAGKMSAMQVMANHERIPPPQHDTPTGPGLLAADLDRIAHEHFWRGHTTAKQQGDVKLDEMRAQLGNAYDEGYTAGRAERAQGLARDVFLRLSPVGYNLDALVVTLAGLPANGSLKAETRARLAALVEQAQTAVVELGEFAEQISSSEAAAAAQVARDA